MNVRHLLLIATAALLLVIAPASIQAQEEEDENHIYTVSTMQWPFNNLGEIFEMIEETHELTEQNEFIISQKVLTHQWGGSFSVMFINEYASLEDIPKAQARGTELFEAKYPDEAERDARNKKFVALTGDGLHEDNIMQENSKLAK